MTSMEMVGWIVCIALVAGSWVQSLRAQGPDTPESQPSAAAPEPAPVPPAPDGQTLPPRLPIVAWYGLFGPSATSERFAELAAAGFTHNTGWFGSVEELRKAMDAAQPAGIKLIARAPLLDSDPEAFAAQVKDHPAFGGHFIADEPGASQFDQLGQLVRRLQAVDPDHLCYINLFPDWADGAKQMEAENYEQYLRQFIQKVPVQVISFDHYPVVEGGITGTFYRNLEEVSRASSDAGKPFWAFALSIPHANHPVPTLAHLRFQQYTNLACGAQGLQYFTYTTPEDRLFGAGPLDRDLQRTPIYDLLVQLNRELQAQAWVFIGSRVLSVSHIGPHSPEGATAYVPADPIRSLEVKGRGAVVSLLENNGRRHLVIVNHSYVKPAQVQVSWDPACRMQQVDKGGLAHDLPGDSLQQPLETGDAMILTWEAGDAR